VSFAAITFCVASQRVLIAVSIYFVIDSVRKLLDTPSYVLEYKVAAQKSAIPLRCEQNASKVLQWELLGKTEPDSPVDKSTWQWTISGRHISTAADSLAELAKRLLCGPYSENGVHPCIKNSFKITGNGSEINHFNTVLKIWRSITN